MITPKKLGKEPLLEAICEVRFSSDKESVINLLPGILYQKYKDRFNKIINLPAKNLPVNILKQDPALKYTPTIRLDSESYLIQLGEHVVSLSCRKPYKGWTEFKSEIEGLVEKLQETDLITNPERFSLKYIDIIPSEVNNSLSALNVDVRLGNHEVTTESISIRTEKEEDGFIHIIQVGSPVKAKLSSDDEYDGVMLDIDTIKKPEADFWGNFSSNLDRAHQLNKEMFFSLLTEKTLSALIPEY